MVAGTAYSVDDVVRLERTVDEFSAGTICVVRAIEEGKLVVETRSPIPIMRNDVTFKEDEGSVSRTVPSGRVKYPTFNVDPQDVIAWNP